MTLAYDFARCAGRITAQSVDLGGVSVTTTIGQSQCALCRRREPGAPDRPQPHMSPPVFVGGKCPERIEP